MSLRLRSCLPLLIVTLPVTPPTSAQPLYLGSAAPAPAAGLYRAHFDPDTGTFSDLRQLAPDQPFFFRLSTDGHTLYATGHEGASETPGVLRSYSVKADKSLTLTDTQTFPGKVPLHLSLSPDARFALVANYLTANVHSLPLLPGGDLAPAVDTVTLTGSGIHPDRQNHAYPHSVNYSPDGRFAFVCDRGADRIASYAVNVEHGTLTALERQVMTRPGSGPRHLAFHPDGQRAYVINEINGSLTAYHYDRTTGHLQEGPSYPTVATDDATLNFSAEVAVHPQGGYVYTSNRGPDTLTVFAVGAGTQLEWIQTIPSGGQHPRYFAIDPTGRWLLCSNRHSDRVTIFALNPQTGQLTPTPQHLDLPVPLGLAFAP